MKGFRKVPTATPEQVIALAQAQIEVENARAQAAREQELAEEQHRQRRDAAKAAGRAMIRARRTGGRKELVAQVRTLAPLLIVNGAAVYGQLDYAYREVAPDGWNQPAQVALAVMFALAVESIALYIQWHAHDALLLKAYATAARLRRASYTVAGVVAAINYTHFADGSVFKPTAAGVAFGLLSLLSPWLWGLHTRRAQRVQLLAEDANLIDEAGAEFSTARRRAFPWRTWQARRWSIDHGVRDPRLAWEQYNAERVATKAQRASLRAERAERREARRDARASTKAVNGDATAGAPTAAQGSVAVAAAASPMSLRLRHRPRIRRVKVTHPAPRVTAGQDVVEDSRSTHDIDLAVRVMAAGAPDLPKRRIAFLIGTSDAKVRRALRRDQNPEPPPRVNGNRPELEGATAS